MANGSGRFASKIRGLGFKVQLSPIKILLSAFGLDVHATKKSALHPKPTSLRKKRLRQHVGKTLTSKVHVLLEPLRAPLTGALFGYMDL